MIGTRIESRSSPVGVIVWLCVAAGLLVLAAVMGSVHPVVLAVLPFALAAACALGQPPKVAFEPTEEGLDFTAPEMAIRYEDIQGLNKARRAGNRAAYAMQIYHPGGVIRLPKQLTVPSRDLYEHILAQIALPTAADGALVPASLRGFVLEHAERYGPERVSVYRAREHPPGRERSPMLRTVSLAVAATGVLWIVAGLLLDKKEGEGWLAFGTLALVFGALFFILWLAQRAGRIKNWMESILVVSPGGVALAQGSLKGRMFWREVRAVEHPPKPRAGMQATVDSTSGIGLLVDGAYIVISDYYNRPIHLIYRQIKSYWESKE